MNNYTKNKTIDRLFQGFGIANTFLGLILLAFFIGYIIYIGANRLGLNFLTSLPSRFPEKSGIYTAMIGSVWIMFLTALFAFPVGVAAAVYL